MSREGTTDGADSEHRRRRTRGSNRPRPGGTATEPGAARAARCRRTGQARRRRNRRLKTTERPEARKRGFRDGTPGSSERNARYQVAWLSGRRPHRSPGRRTYLIPVPTCTDTPDREGCSKPRRGRGSHAVAPPTMSVLLRLEDPRVPRDLLCPVSQGHGTEHPVFGERSPG